MEKKPWYKSKIALLAFTAALMIGGNLITGFITGNGITQEQIEAVGTIQPAVAETIQDVKSGQNIFQAITALAFSLIGVWRLWFTTKQIE